MPARIRRAAASDGPALARLRWEFRTEEGEIPREDFREFQLRFLDHYWRGLDAESWAHWLVEEDGSVLAHMAVLVNDGVPRPATARDRWGWLTDCYTVPAERNQGHGTRLLEAIRDWARTEELELVLVSPGDRSVPFYRRAGFEPAGEWLRLSPESSRTATE